MPPQNKPLPAEIRCCNAYLAREMRDLTGVRVYLALGRVAHEAVLLARGCRAGVTLSHTHGEHRLNEAQVHLLDSYHCSRYNTQTRRLTARDVPRGVARACELAGLPVPRRSRAPEKAGMAAASITSSTSPRCPSAPGVYRMYGAEQELLYVGKARSLKDRVGTYFLARATSTRRCRRWCSRSSAIEVTVTNSETEALLLEYNLIKAHKPRFNVVLRDDKSFPYIQLCDDHRFPRLAFYRGARSAGGRYFGPFPNAGAVRDTLNQLQKLFRIRNCRDSFFANRSRPCLQHQIGRCSAPCVGLIDARGLRAGHAPRP